MKNSVAAVIIGRRLEALRKAKSLSQQKLADDAGVGLATVKRIENATVSPSVDILISISQALGIHLYELFDDEAITTSDKGKRHE